jgi:hypothetical protein
MPKPIDQAQNQQFAQALRQYQADHDATRVEFVGGTAYPLPRTPSSAAPEPAAAKPTDTREFQRITSTPNRNCSAGVFKPGGKS